MSEVHIFDVDHTIIKQSTGRCFIKEALSNNLVTMSQVVKLPIKYIMYKLGLLPPEAVEREIRNLKGIKIDLLQNLSLDSFNRQGKSQLYTDVIQRISELKSQGHRIIAATSSVEFLVEPLLNYLEIDEFIATKMEVIDGEITGKTIGSPVFGNGKKVAVEAYFKEQNLDLNKAIFYTDSINDLPLLQTCGTPIAVNPDRLLRKKARKSNWKILIYKDILGK
ncbi:MAG: hypothetical protein B6229_07975 [Spirochaetaceae bacterium 4572_7]|nr:MAG: hypothetical protein B6229_07975 [Spirochaetaceae bacterium 4572_7]